VIKILVATFVFIFALLIGFPIAFVIGLSSFSSIALDNIPLTVIPQRMFSGIDVFVVMAVPFFILTGEIMNRGGVSQRLIRFAEVIVGRVKGGLAYSNIIASMFFGGISGAAIADVSAIGSVMIPAMEKSGYKRSFSSAITACSSVVGPIIPPSIPAVLYAMNVSGVSVGALFVAGIVPGIMLGGGLMLVCALMANKENFPKREKVVTAKEFFKILFEAFLALIAPLIIIGGIIFGIFTPTEASVIAVVYSVIIASLIYRQLSLRDIIESLKQAGITTSILFLVVSTAYVMAYVFSIKGVAPSMASFIVGIVGENPFLFLLMVNILLLVIGTFMEFSAVIIVLGPMLAPIAVQLGIDPLHFGVIFIVNLAIGLTTPPLGVCLFATSGIANISLEQLSKAVLPFLLVKVMVLFLITYLPFFSLYIPELLNII